MQSIFNVKSRDLQSTKLQKIPQGLSSKSNNKCGEIFCLAAEQSKKFGRREAASFLEMFNGGSVCWTGHALQNIGCWLSRDEDVG